MIKKLLAGSMLAATIALSPAIIVTAHAQDMDQGEHMDRGGDHMDRGDHMMRRHMMHREMRHEMMRHEMHRHMMHHMMRREMQDNM